MRHPDWRCQNCGERLYEHVEVGYQCLNCGRRYSIDELEGNAV
ncbi:hypothetical protein [Natronorubrum halalkaliphilum]|nr:hypothetical protein [Natronorubrum halalkaliphilum]